MNTVKKRFQLDIATAGSQLALYARKGDQRVHACYVTLCDGCKPMCLQGDLRAVIRAKKPDGNVLMAQAEIEDGLVKVYFPTQTFTAEGVVACQLTIYGANQQTLFYPRFDMVVEPMTVEDESITSSAEFGALSKAISDVIEITADVETAERERQLLAKQMERAIKKFDGLTGSGEMVSASEDISVRVRDYDERKHIEVRVPRSGQGMAVALGKATFALHVDERGHLMAHYNAENGVPPLRLIDGHLMYVLEGGGEGQPPVVEGTIEALDMAEID
ncbi:MAG: BppU family phage baseplate upper protein, partial [Clostridia bacterium]